MDHHTAATSLYCSTIVIETTHTWLWDLSFHGNRTAKKGVARETEERGPLNRSEDQQINQGRSCFDAQHIILIQN